MEWVTEAAEHRSKLRAMARTIAEYEAEHGRFTDEESADARQRSGTFR